MAVLTIWPRSVQKLEVNKTRSNPRLSLKVNPKTSQVLLQIIVIPKVKQASLISQEEIMDTQKTNDSVQENLNITEPEPDPELQRFRLDDVFAGPVSPDPGDDAESISSIE